MTEALTGGDITRYRALVARISYLSQDRPDLKFASMKVCCAMAKPSWSVSRGSENTSLGNRESRAGFVGSRVESSVSAGVVMRGGHCLKVRTKKQQVVSLSSAESELYAAVKAATQGLG